MDRRTFTALISTGFATALAGCNGTQSEEEGTATSTEDSTGTPTQTETPPEEREYNINNEAPLETIISDMENYISSNNMMIVATQTTWTHEMESAVRWSGSVNRKNGAFNSNQQAGNKLIQEYTESENASVYIQQKTNPDDPEVTRDVISPDEHSKATPLKILFGDFVGDWEKNVLKNGEIEYNKELDTETTIGTLSGYTATFEDEEDEMIIESRILLDENGVIYSIITIVYSSDATKGVSFPSRLGRFVDGDKKYPPMLATGRNIRRLVPDGDVRVPAWVREMKGETGTETTETETTTTEG